MTNDNQTEIEKLSQRVARLEDIVTQLVDILKKRGTFLDTLTSIFQSKKALAAIAAIGIGAAKSLGLDIDTDEFIGILSILGVYITGQGIADHGKEKAKIENAKSSTDKQGDSI